MDRVLKVLVTLTKRVNSPLSKAVRGLAESGRWTELQQLRVDPAHYPDAFSYWKDAMCVDLVRKMHIPFSDAEPEQAAVDKFLETERICYRVNQKIRTLIKEDPGKIPASDWAVIDFLNRWKLKIRNVMGKVPESLVPRFSGGATTSTNRLESTTLDKLSMTPERYSHSAFVVDHCFYETVWGQVAHERGLYPRVASGNEYFVVPKNGLTGRSACKEAVLNVSYQLAVGAVFRRRLLKKMSIDLDHGATVHRVLAREGSVFGNYATLDLSSASDRWARELVRFLVPWDWEILLNGLRATHTLFGGKRLFLEKFSSMGNGFTFELETILFATLAATVAEVEGIDSQVWCYGDDLIVRTELALPLGSWLRAFGHDLNVQKSFSEGPFRESCGGDFFHGHAVNTVKPEEIPETPTHWISLANNLRRVAAGRDRYWALIKPVWDAVLANIPNQIRRLRGPVHLGDQVIHDTPPEGGWHGYGYVYRPIGAKLHIVPEQWPFYALIGYKMMSTEPIRSGLPLRKVAGFKVVKTYFGPTSSYLPGDQFREIPEVVTLARRVAREQPYWL